MAISVMKKRAGSAVAVCAAGILICASVVVVRRTGRLQPFEPAEIAYDEPPAPVVQRTGRLQPFVPAEIAYDGPSARLANTIIVPTLDTPIPDGKNVIWCCSFQMAWNRLREDVIKGPIRVANAQGVANRLNRASQRDHDLPEGSYYAAAGWVKDGIVTQIQEDMATQFPAQPVRLSDVSPGTMLIAYAFLAANVKLDMPFLENTSAFVFRSADGTETTTTSFGIREEDEYAYQKLRSQVEVLYHKRERADHSAEAEFIVDLCRSSRPSQVILARIERGSTLAETIASVEGRTSDSCPRPAMHWLFDSEVLLMPNIHFRLEHRFSELEGEDKVLLNPGVEGFIAKAWQVIHFRLDRSGAQLGSTAKLYSESMPPRSFVFDKPFLVLMKKRGAGNPYFVMWVDNAELLCEWSK